MSILIDTHAHIYLENFAEDLDAVIERSVQAGVKKVLMPNIDSGTILEMLKVETTHPEICHSMMGLHPCSVKQNYREELDIVEEWFDKRDFIAVGEIGTDLYWDKTFSKEQIEAFEFQADLAIRKSRPIVIHCRDSLDLTIDLVENLQDGNLKGVFHCFTGTLRQAYRITELGFMLGIGGVSTFKNGGMDSVLPAIPLESIILETDSPYLTPTPYRGKRNEPSYITLIADRVADLKQVGVSRVKEVTTENAEKLFLNGLQAN